MATTTRSPSPSIAPRPQTAGGLGLLTGPDMTDVLQAVLDTAGGRLVSWRACQVDHQPGRGTTVGYRARVRWPHRQVTDERFAACSLGDPDQAPAGALVLDDGADRVAVWRFPYDPDLPALAAAYDETAVADLLRDMGLRAGRVRLRLRAYRPRRRAVVEAVGTGGRLFLKVVRPSRAQAIHERHRLLVASGVPAPQSLGWTPSGLIVLEPLAGRTLRQAIRAGVRDLPAADAVLAVLDRLPEQLADGPRRDSWLRRVPHYGAVLGTALPAVADHAGTLSGAITAEAGTGPVVATHGDLYESQFLVRRGRICGLLDIDTVGPGERLDDLACLLGHLSVLAQIDRGRAAAISRLGARYLARFEQTVDPADLRYRVAAVVMSLATGPHRVQEPGWPAATRRRLERAEQWLDSARDLRGHRR